MKGEDATSPRALRLNEKGTSLPRHHRAFTADEERAAAKGGLAGSHPSRSDRCGTGPESGLGTGAFAPAAAFYGVQTSEKNRMSLSAARRLTKAPQSDHARQRHLCTDGGLNRLAVYNFHPADRHGACILRAQAQFESGTRQADMRAVGTVIRLPQSAWRPTQQQRTGADDLRRDHAGSGHAKCSTAASAGTIQCRMLPGDTQEQPRPRWSDARRPALKLTIARAATPIRNRPGAAIMRSTTG